MNDSDSSTFSKEFFVGAFVMAGLGLLVFFVASIGGLSHWFSGQKQVRVRFDNLGGLKEGQPVLYAGYQVGTVTNIALHQKEAGKIVTTLSVKKDIPLYEKSRFTITSSGLIGDKVVDIIPPENPDRRAKSGSVFEGDDPVSLTNVLGDIRGVLGSNSQQNIQEILNNATQTSENLAVTSRRLQAMVRKNDEKLNQMVDRFHTGSRQLERMLTDADTAVESVRTLSGKLLRLTEDNRPRVNQTISNLQEASNNLKQISENVKGDPSSLFWGD